MALADTKEDEIVEEQQAEAKRVTEIEAKAARERVEADKAA